MGKRKIDNPPLLIRSEFRRMFDKLSNEETGVLLHALMEYRWDGVLPELSARLSGVFLTLQAFADEDGEKYREVCENNRRAAIARWTNKDSSDATECE